MSAPPILSAIFRERSRNWGPEDDGHTFESNGAQPLDRIDVFVYRPNQETPMTIFATIGMAAKEMPGGGRAELHFAVRGTLSPEHERAIASQLANLACFPWQANAAVSWGHTVPLGKDFPGFPGCSSVFLSGPFVNDGWAWIDAGDEKVRVINVVPITEAERNQAKQTAPPKFVSELMAARDIFALP